MKYAMAGASGPFGGGVVQALLAGSDGCSG